MTEDDLAQKATVLRVALEVGVATVQGIVRWADSEILRREHPPYELLQLSGSAVSNPHDVRSTLQRLAGGTSIHRAIREALGSMCPQILERPDLAPGFAARFYQICVELSYELPDDLKPLLQFDDRFALAKEGTYSSEQAVFEDFVEFASHFRAHADKPLEPGYAGRSTSSGPIVAGKFGCTPPALSIGYVIQILRRLLLVK